MRDTPFTFRDACTGDGPDIRHVVDTVLREHGMQLEARGLDDDLSDVEASYRNRGGVFRVLTDAAGTIVGCGGLYPLADGEAEIRKMYFLLPARGRGLGLSLLEELVTAARERGFERVVLETNSVLKRAIAIYRQYGFVESQRAHLAGRCDKSFELTLSTP